MAKPNPARPMAKQPSNARGSGHPLYERGLRHLDAVEIPAAIQCFETALAQDPTPDAQAAILFALARAARGLGHTRAAEDFLSRVLALDPGRIEALVNLANLYRATGRFRQAQILIGEALETHPSACELWLTLGNVMRETGDMDKAETFFAEALRLKPGYANALASLGDLAVDRGDGKTALKHYDAALRKAPTNAEIRLHRGLVLLSEGHIEAGWRDYAYRFKAAQPPLSYRHGLKAWDGRPLATGGLLITAEQGLGDQIIFASCIGAAIERASAKTVLIDCEPRLMKLFAQSFPVAEIHPFSVRAEAGWRIVDYPWRPTERGATCAIVMGSLPGLLTRQTAAPHNPHGYLTADQGLSARWRDWLSEPATGPRIGVCWRSGNMQGLRAQQFAPLSAWARFLRDTKAHFVSLQYDATPEDVAALNAASGGAIAVPPGLDQKNDLDGAAALIANLDAVVTAPTAVSALAAGLGRPTFKILFDRSWTSLGQDFEPLAPACRLMRPTKPGDWAEVFAQTQDELARLT